GRQLDLAIRVRLTKFVKASYGHNALETIVEFVSLETLISQRSGQLLGFFTRHNQRAGLFGFGETIELVISKSRCTPEGCHCDGVFGGIIEQAVFEVAS